jgi:aminomethyltransferase
MLKSPVHDAFAECGAVFEDCGGHAVAVRTCGPEAEGNAIRRGVGIWDHSDMGKIRLRGDGARVLLELAVSGDIESLPENAIRYTLVLDEAGKIVSDVQVYNNFSEYLVTCPGDRTEHVLESLLSRNSGDVDIENVTDGYAAICIEGPQAWKIPGAVAGIDVRSLRLLTFSEFDISGVKAFLSRIGYCGEYGYILFIPPEAAADGLRELQRQRPSPVLCGRDVQDLLRLEVRSFNLHRDIPRGESPLEAGLHWMINFRKDDFIGRDAIQAERDRGVARKLVAFECASEHGRSDLRKVRDETDTIGYVANFDFSPRRERTIGLAYLDAQYGWPGLDFEVEAAAGWIPVKTVSAPFVHTESNSVQAS